MARNIGDAGMAQRSRTSDCVDHTVGELTRKKRVCAEVEEGRERGIEVEQKNGGHVRVEREHERGRRSGQQLTQRLHMCGRGTVKVVRRACIRAMLLLLQSATPGCRESSCHVRQGGVSWLTNGKTSELFNQSIETDFEDRSSQPHQVRKRRPLHVADIGDAIAKLRNVRRGVLMCALHHGHTVRVGSCGGRECIKA
eukprot:5926765-Pleurochrysis_carterae.AAC.8